MSTLKTTNIAHPSSASNNIVLDSSGGVDMDAFTVSGSAPADSVNLDASGRLLVGTSTSVSTEGQSKLQIAGTDGGSHLSLGNYESNASGPFMALAKSRGTSVGSSTVVSSGDQLGTIGFYGADGTDLNTPGAYIQAFVDGTPGANDMPGRLVFSTTADGASSPTEAVRIDSSQRMWLETAYASAASFVSTSKLKISASSSANTGNVCIECYGNSTAARSQITFSNPNGAVGSISTNASATTYNTSSDYRLKENVVPLIGAIDRVNQLQVHRFNFIADPDTTVDGFIAHEAQAVVPECVTGTKDEVDEDGNPVYQGIDQSKLVPLLTAALQEALAKIEVLEQRLTDAGIA